MLMLFDMVEVGVGIDLLVFFCIIGIVRFWVFLVLLGLLVGLEVGVFIVVSF